MNQRSRLRYTLSLALLGSLLGGLLLAAGGGARPDAAAARPAPQDQVEVTPAASVHDSTIPLKDMQALNCLAGREKKRVLMNPHLIVSLGPPKPDPALQKTPLLRKKTAAHGPHAPALQAGQSAPLKSFDGNSSGDPCVGGMAPPDTVGAVGDAQYVQWVNTSVSVYDKATGQRQAGPVLGNMLFHDLGGNCARNNDGDPVVQYDKIARRWVIGQFSVKNGASSGYSQCVAVSITPDAAGLYHLYEFRQPAFDDYPKMGVWPDGYYTSFNMYDDSQQNFLGSRVCAFDRAKMLAGQPAAQQCFQLSVAFFGLLPSDLDGATASLADAAGNATGPLAPPAGSPNYFLAVGRDMSHTLDFWKFHVDWANPHNTTFGVGGGHEPNAVIETAAYRLACGGRADNCVPQPGGTSVEKLDTLGDRLMFRLAYRRFNGANGALDHESLVVGHSVDVGTAGTQTAVRWYEIRNPGGTPSVFQQGSYAPDAAHRWIGSVAMDKRGDIAAGYNVSGAAVFPGIRYTSRSPSDPLGKLGAETTLIAGTGSQTCRPANGSCPQNCKLTDGTCSTDTLTRWGDYSDLSVDPMDDCTFWYTTEYEKARGVFNWRTHIGSFKVAGCS